MESNLTCAYSLQTVILIGAATKFVTDFQWIHGRNTRQSRENFVDRDLGPESVTWLGKAVKE